MVPDLIGELKQAFESLGSGVRAAVLTGAGSAFCVGADLKWLGSEEDPGAAVAGQVEGHHEAIRAMRETPVPVIAAVNGAAAGGGWSLALAADLCIAAATATFTAAYFRLGLTPDGGNSAFWARAI